MGCFENVYLPELPQRTGTIYMYLKNHAGKGGACWLGCKTISRELMSRSTIKRALDDLRQAKLIAKAPRRRDNGSLNSNHIFKRIISTAKGLFCFWMVPQVDGDFLSVS